MTAGYVELHAASFYSFGVGAVAHPRAAGPGGRARLRRPGPHRRQPLRGAGVRPPRQQPRRPAHHRGRADPQRRLPSGASGQDAAGLRQHLPAVHSGQRHRPEAAQAGPHPPVRACRRRDPPHRRPRRTARQPGARWPPGGGCGPAQAVHGVVRPGLGISRSAAQLSIRGHPPQPRAGGPRRRSGRSAGRHQRRSLPRPRALPPPTRVGGGEEKHHHRPSPPLHPPEPSSVLEVSHADGAPVSGPPRRPRQHPADRGAVLLQPRHRLGLHPPRPRDAGGVHRRKLPGAALRRGRRPPLRLSVAARGAAPRRGDAADT